MNRLLKSLPDPLSAHVWLLVTLVVKVATLVLLFRIGAIGHGNAGVLGVWWADAPTYFEPMESLLRGGGYDPDLRMPGYGVVYLLLRLFTEPPVTYDVLVILQSLLASVSMYILARLVWQQTGSKALFVLSMAVYALSISVHWYDAVMLTESFCVSALIFFLDRWVHWSRTGNRASLVFAGLWLTWAIFLKPVLAPIPAFVLLGLWLARSDWRQLLRNAMLFLLPLMAFDGAWMARNALRHGKPIVLTRVLFVGEDDPKPKLTALKFVWAIGGDITWWTDPQAEMRFFNTGLDQLPGSTNASSIILPNRILTSAYTMDSLRAAADEILALKSDTVSADYLHHRNLALNAKFDRWTAAFIAEHPAQYYLLSRLLALRRYVFQTGNPIAYSLPFRQMPLHHKALKLFHFGLHWATLLGGMLGAWWWLRNGNNRSLAVVPSLIVPFGIFVIPFALRFSEHRYMVPFIPFMLLCLIIGSHLRFKHNA
ncbi:MAG: hypothetical protein IPJ85_14960 [Flavobacteriales bacterium]|nr:hypothetical protein [Flavobacteriales bacterium]